MEDQSINQEVNLKSYLQVLSRRRWVIITFFVICVTTVTIGTFMMTPVYRAGTKIIIEGENTSIRTAEDSSMSGTGIEIYENYLETQMSLIKSDSIAGRVADEFKLSDTPRYKKKEGLAKLFQHSFEKDLNLERVKGTRMVIIWVDNPEPKMAADLANRLAEVYTKDNMKRRALTFIRNQRMASLNAEFLRLQEKLDNLSTQFGPKHPEMVVLREEIRTMAKRIENERFGSGSQDGLGDKTAAQPQQVLEESLLKIQESSVFSSSKVNNTGIVDLAYPPTEIFRPKIPINIALGFVMGLVGGILLAYFVDYLDDSIKTEDDLKRYISGAPFLGPVMSERTLKNGLNKTSDIDRLVEIRSESPSAESYRLIRTRILWSISRDHVFKDFAVVSAGASEGKSTVASNLAISLSQINKKVLLVDTDLRRGRLYDSYNLVKDKGLGEYLSGDAKLDDVIQKTLMPNLSAVVAGRSVIDTSQLFSSDRMKEFIQETRKKFDVIVYDTPPVIVISDTSILVPQLGGVVFTIRSGVTNARRLNKAMNIIKETGNAQVIGVILNGADLVDKKVYKNYYHKI